METQPDPRASGRSERRSASDLTERLEDPLDVLARDSDARVAGPKPDVVPLTALVSTLPSTCDSFRRSARSPRPLETSSVAALRRERTATLEHAPERYA